MSGNLIQKSSHKLEVHHMAVDTVNANYLVRKVVVPSLSITRT